MNKLSILGAAATLLFVPATASAGDITGIWHTGSEGGKVQIYKCGNAYCGKIVDAARLRANPDLRDVRNSNADLRSRRLKGLVVLRNFTGGPSQWSGGPVYDPESGDGANSGKLRLVSRDKLEVKGCVAVFCRTKIWTRAK
ncbi:MAG: DUF2147 domain-containing protein [Citromicrobium sp.]|nr:MAG: DUF2147 domain-containing protein [Citromicrobium sp.]